MATILQKATEILDQKNRKIIPENLRKGVKVFGVEGTLDPTEVVDGVDTFDADAIPSDIIKDRTAYVNNEKITGTMEEITSINKDSASINIDNETEQVSFISDSIVQGNDPEYIQKGTTATISTSFETLQNEIGLTSDKIKSGETILGIEGELEEGIDTSDATATSNDLLEGTTAYVNGEKVEGNIKVNYNTSIDSLDIQSINTNQNNIPLSISVEFGLALIGSFNDTTLTLRKFNADTGEYGDIIQSGNIATTWSQNSHLCGAAFGKIKTSEGKVPIWVVSKNGGDGKVLYATYREYNPVTNEVENSSVIFTQFANYTSWPLSVKAFNVAVNPKDPTIMACHASCGYKTYQYTHILYLNAEKTAIMNTVTTSFRTTDVDGGNRTVEWDQEGKNIMIYSSNKIGAQVIGYLKFDKQSYALSLLGSYSVSDSYCTYKDRYVFCSNKFQDIVSNTTLYTYDELRIMNNTSANGGLQWTVNDFLFRAYNRTNPEFKIYKMNWVDGQIYPNLELIYTATNIAYNSSYYYNNTGSPLFPNTGSDWIYLNSLSSGWVFKPEEEIKILDTVNIKGQIATNISDISTTTDKVLTGYIFGSFEGKQTGTMANNGELILTPNDEEIIIPEGYTSGGKVNAANITLLADYIKCLGLSNEILFGEAKLYKELEYIETDQHQYMELPDLTNDNYGYEIDVMLLDDTGPNLFGGASTTGDVSLFTYFGLYDDKCTYHFNSTTEKVFINGIDNNRHVYKSIKTSTGYANYLDNTSIGNVTATIPGNCKITLFSFYDYSTGTRVDSAQMAKCRLYGFKIYNGETVVHNYIPVKQNDTNIVCLYDLINNTFLENLGSESLIAGPEINGGDV